MQNCHNPKAFSRHRDNKVLINLQRFQRSANIFASDRIRSNQRSRNILSRTDPARRQRQSEYSKVTFSSLLYVTDFHSVFDMQILRDL